jgi:F-type H+-transporting ATPase subunit epsilon
MTLHVELVSPEEAVWQGEVESVLLRTIGGGEIQFLTGHAPFLGALDICSIEMRLSDGTLETCAVRGGFVEVSNNRVKILSDDADRPEHIDPDAARAAREQAEELLRRVEGEQATKEAADEVKWQSARLRAVGHE